MEVLFRLFELLVIHFTRSASETIETVKYQLPHANREVEDQHQPAYEVQQRTNKDWEWNIDFHIFCLSRAWDPLSFVGDGLVLNAHILVLLSLILDLFLLFHLILAIQSFSLVKQPCGFSQF